MPWTTMMSMPNNASDDISRLDGFSCERLKNGESPSIIFKKKKRDTFMGGFFFTLGWFQRNTIGIWIEWLGKTLCLIGVTHLVSISKLVWLSSNVLLSVENLILLSNWYFNILVLICSIMLRIGWAYCNHTPVCVSLGQLLDSSAYVCMYVITLWSWYSNAVILQQHYGNVIMLY